MSEKPPKTPDWDKEAELIKGGVEASLEQMIILRNLLGAVEDVETPISERLARGVDYGQVVAKVSELSVTELIAFLSGEEVGDDIAYTHAAIERAREIIEKESQ